MTLYTRVLSYLRSYPVALAAAGAATFAFAALDAQRVATEREPVRGLGVRARGL